MPVIILSLVTLTAFGRTLLSAIIISLILLSPLQHQIWGETVMFMSLAVTVAAATEMARDRAMVPHMAHVATDLRGK